MTDFVLADTCGEEERGEGEGEGEERLSTRGG